MQDSNIPVKISIPFAKNAGSSYIRSIPQTSQIGIHDGFASYPDGFVPLNMTPVGAGGVPPFGQDMNGILNAITQWTQWYNAGGPVAYDAAFSAAVGGYPKGAVLSASILGGFWLSIIENNTSNPDVGGGGWLKLIPTNLYSTDGGPPNTVQVNYVPVQTTHVVGLVLGCIIGNANTGPFTFDPGPGPLSVYYGTGSAPLPGMIAPGTVAYFVCTGGNYQLINPVWGPAATKLVSGGSSTVTSFAGGGPAGPTGILSLDGSGNAGSNFKPSGSLGVLVSTTGALYPAGDFGTWDGSGNLGDAGYNHNSFDAAGTAAALVAGAYTLLGTLALGLFTFTHNLGFNTNIAQIQITIVCTSPDAGYSVGDALVLGSSGPANSSNNVITCGHNSSGNSSFVIFGTGVTVLSKGTHVPTNLTLSNWNLYMGVRASH